MEKGGRGGEWGDDYTILLPVALACDVWLLAVCVFESLFIFLFCFCFMLQMGSGVFAFFVRKFGLLSLRKAGRNRDAIPWIVIFAAAAVLCTI